VFSPNIYFKSLLHGSKNLFHYSLQFGQIVLDSFPDDLQIHTEIFMYHLIPHRCNLSPLDLGASGFRRCRQLFTASPITSSFLMTASCRIRSRVNVLYPDLV
jgi:hypothetical protein